MCVRVHSECHLIFPVGRSEPHLHKEDVVLPLTDGPICLPAPRLWDGLDFSFCIYLSAR